MRKRIDHTSVYISVNPCLKKQDPRPRDYGRYARDEEDVTAHSLEVVQVKDHKPLFMQLLLAFYVLCNDTIHTM